MLPILIGAGALLLATKKKPKQTAKTGNISETPQANKYPQSAHSNRQDVGRSSNQPWYTGFLPQGSNGSAQTIIAGAGALSALSSSAYDWFGSDNSDSGVDQSAVDQAPDFSEDANSDSESYPVDESAGSTSDVGDVSE